MFFYIMRRFLYMIILLLSVSVVSFIIIQLPPGDWLTTYIASLEARGQRIDEAQIATLRKQYGLDQPPVIQYFKWITNLSRGNLGFSFSYNKPINDLLKERLPITILLSSFTLLFTYIIAIPIGIYSAIHKYSTFDYLFTIIGFIGLSIPGFLFALILNWIFHNYFGLSIGGLFSAKYIGITWSLEKFFDMLKHLPTPLIVIGLSGTAGIIRIMRGCLLDELNKQYVITARTKGLPEKKLMFKYPVRIAINPILSTIGWTLPGIFSGETIVSLVLNLPTMGPLLYNALTTQDMYLAGSIIMILTLLVCVGTLISDILLALADPRIRFGM